MPLSIYPMNEDFVAEVYDVDLANLDADTLEEVKQAFWKYAILIFPEQKLQQQQHVDFARNFGPMDETVLKTAMSDHKLRIREDISDVSNLAADNKIWAGDDRLRQLQMGNRIWHTDSSFKYIPALASLLYAVEVPPVGGQTAFADLRAAYDALDEDMKVKLSTLVAEHSLVYSRQRLGYTEWKEHERQGVNAVPQTLVRTVPQTGRKNLYVASHAGHIVGMDDAEAKPLIDQLVEHATQRQFVHIHRWRQGDVVMWDNRCALHKGLPFDDLRFRRDMQRATVQDIANSCEQEGVPVPDVNLREPAVAAE
jgi:alpha-ketoglutarate-dependent 2,4-dichlorophenoxyacetate dioxygenase